MLSHSMRIFYTGHILKRIKERGILPSQIEQTISRPDTTLVSFKGRCLVQRMFCDRILEVIYTLEDERMVLITAYWQTEGN